MFGKKDNQGPDDRQQAKVQAQVVRAGVDAGAASTGSLLTAPVLVVNQKAKLIEVTNQYSVFDQQGGRLGSVNEIGQSKAKKVLRVVSNLDQFMTHRLEIRDVAGGHLLSITRPRKFLKSTVIVEDAGGAEIGKIVQENMIGKIHFSLEAGGQTVGSIRAENWRAWDFRLEDASGAEVGRVTKTWGGLAKAAFTNADNYVVQIDDRVAQPLRSLLVAAALCVDTALKQDSR